MVRQHNSVRLTVFIIVAILCAGSSAALAGTYIEDFTTTRYRDSVYTTAKWDTTGNGSVRLPQFRLRRIGADGGGPLEESNDVAITGDYAYVARGSAGLVVIDIGDPANPVVVGTCATPGDALGVAVAGDHAYVGAGDSGFHVIDIGDPTNPVIVGSLASLRGTRKIALSGDHAYVANGIWGFTVVDISDPANPAIVDYDVPGSEIHDVAVAGDYAYVPDGTNGLLVYDIGDPTAIVLAGSAGGFTDARGIAVAGNHAFVTDAGTNSLRVIDISDPTDPFLLDYCVTGDQGRDVTISGDYAYVSDGNTGVVVVDISDPTDPLSLSSAEYDTPGNALRAAISGRNLYVADTDSLLVLEICGPEPIASVDVYDTPGNAFRLDIDGDYAYIADGLQGVQVIDISDPENLAFAGNYSASGYPRDVAVAGDFAYVAGQNDGLLVLDISDPASPALAGFSDSSSSAQGVAVSGDLVCVADGIAGLEFFDVADPAAPDYLGVYDTPGLASAVVVEGNLAFVADGSAGLQIVDVHTRLLVGSAATTGDAKHLAVAGDYAFVASLDAGLEVFDIGDPSNPTLAGACPDVGRANGVAVAGDYAFVADYNGAFRVVDITDPANPAVSDSLDLPAYVWGVAYEGDYVFLANGSTGLQSVSMFQRRLDTNANVARSLPIDESGGLIGSARFFYSHTDSIRLQLSADGGANWQDFLPGDWQDFSFQGPDLLWRSTHTYLGGGANPNLALLSVYWLTWGPDPISITDVPNDQGRQVSVVWERSSFDKYQSEYPIVEYAVYRRIDDLDADPPAKEGGVDALYPPGDWHYLMSVPADREDQYAVVVPTLVDSTVQDGMAYSVFFIRARTATPGVYFDSDVDSGYSVDNLVPSAPAGLTIEQSGGMVTLAWSPNGEEDLDYYAVYRGTDPDFDPSDPVGYTTGEQYQETAEPVPYWYKITAVDFSGNESEPSSASIATGVTAAGTAPFAFFLGPAVPNPFNPSTTITYGIPGGTPESRVTVTVYAILGREVRTLVDREQGPGRYTVAWDGTDESGSAVASGAYFYRITWSGGREAKRMILVR